MNKNLSLESMTAIFSIEKAEEVLENLRNRDIIQNDNESLAFLNKILYDLRYLKEHVNNE